jgi:hypothetical protein
MIAKSFLIMGGKVNEAKFPHLLIIQRMYSFSRARFTNRKPNGDSC